MLQIEVVVQNETGLHARPASLLVQKANEFESTITLTVDEKHANAKSILSVLGLGATKGKNLIVIADGKDEELAIKEMVKLLNGFDE